MFKLKPTEASEQVSMSMLMHFCNRLLGIVSQTSESSHSVIYMTNFLQNLESITR